jgi:hypothetical protein
MIAILQRVRRDLEQACRISWRDPAFTLVTLLTLTLGIGANRGCQRDRAVLLKALPVPDSTASSCWTNTGATIAAAPCPGWTSAIGETASAIGKSIDLNGSSYAVIGVLPPTFAFFDARVDVYLPVGLHGSDTEWTRRGNHPDLLGLARLKRGNSLSSARDAFDVLMKQLEDQYPRSYTGLTTTIIVARRTSSRQNSAGCSRVDHRGGSTVRVRRAAARRIYKRWRKRHACRTPEERGPMLSVSYLRQRIAALRLYKLSQSNV